MGLCVSKEYNQPISPSTSPDHSPTQVSTPVSRGRESPLSDFLGRAPRASGSEGGAVRPRIKLGTSPVRLSLPRTHSLEKHEIQQVAYHLGAFAAGDSVSDPSRLAIAGQTVHDVRTQLRHGRGNVAVDFAPTNGYNGIAASVAYRGMDFHNELGRSVVMGGGNCDQFAGLTAVTHAPHMEQNDTMALVGGTVDLAIIDDQRVVPTREGHVWAEWRTEDGRNGDSTIVMDGWANGPAVRLKDSRWSDAANQKETFSTGKEDNAWHKDRIELLAAKLHPAEDESVAQDLQWKLKKPTAWEQYEEAQVVSSEFAARSRYGLSLMTQGEQVSLASSIAKQTYRLSNEKAASPRMVGAVIEQAHRLDLHDRPPVLPPEQDLI